MANPTTASAAATTITKNTKTDPSTLLCILEKVTKERFTAFSIISIHINTTMAFLRVRTPIRPIEKIAALTKRYE
jgi:hypothetical protein